MRDNWGSYQTERTELLEFIRDQDIRNIVVISGDMHALAYDDGRCNGYLCGMVRISRSSTPRRSPAMAREGWPYSGGVSERAGALRHHGCSRQRLAGFRDLLRGGSPARPLPRLLGRLTRTKPCQ